MNKKRMGWLKYVFILNLELVTQLTVTPIISIPLVYFFHLHYSDYWMFISIGLVIVAMLLTIPLKFVVLRGIEKVFPKINYPRKPLNYYYWINGMVSIVVNPIAFFWGGMYASAGNFHYFFQGFLYIWWLPNLIGWVLYVIGSRGVEKR
ncbi:hypothetical protein [Candidatus Enterococcus mansonii]|uniref:hypothetical protein n=1 Tax=Candidatus Enterococcus mansonii TaxID=1834181 RepID=UPI001177D4EB|nr:hypothetical protein [Enterococcus sp. 4G2_DIV0659]